MQKVKLLLTLEIDEETGETKCLDRKIINDDIRVRKPSVSVKDNEWQEVGDWMWDNRDSYSGISVLPYSDHSYVQPPFETCTEDVYVELSKSLSNIDLSKVVEMFDSTDLKGEAACGGGGCEVK